jgi:hypothetical protein
MLYSFLSARNSPAKRAEFKVFCKAQVKDKGRDRDCVVIFRIKLPSDCPSVNTKGEPVHYIVEVPVLSERAVTALIKKLPKSSLLYVGKQPFTVEPLGSIPPYPYEARSFTVSVDYV